MRRSACLGSCPPWPAAWLRSDYNSNRLLATSPRVLRSKQKQFECRRLLKENFRHNHMNLNTYLKNDAKVGVRRRRDECYSDRTQKSVMREGECVKWTGAKQPSSLSPDGYYYAEEAPSNGLVLEETGSSAPVGGFCYSAALRCYTSLRTWIESDGLQRNPRDSQVR